MLVVTRKKDEKLIIGNEIEIQVLRIGREVAAGSGIERASIGVMCGLELRLPPISPFTGTRFTKLSSRKMFPQ